MPTNISSGMIPYSSLPEYERPTAQAATYKRGTDTDSVAHVNSDDSQNVYIDKPGQATAPILAHELQHVIQQRAGVHNYPAGPVTNEAQWQATYGLNDLARKQNVSQLTNEQQGELPHQYMDQYAAAVKAKNAKAIDMLNALYARPVQQIQAQVGSGINTTPAAPGPPPAALTGIAVPLPGMMSQSTMSAPLTPFQHLAIAAKSVHNAVK